LHQPLTLSIGHLSLEVLLEAPGGVRLLTEVGDYSAGSLHDVGGLALLIELAETAPLTELHVVGDLDEIDIVLLAESLDKTDVGGLRAVGGEHAKESSAPTRIFH